MKRVVCPECGELLGFRFEKGDPGYIDTSKIEKVRISIGNKKIVELDVKELEKEAASIVNVCSHCGVPYHPFEEKFKR